MSAVLEYDRAFAVRPWDAFADFFAAVADTETLIEERIAEAERSLELGEAQLADSIATLTRLISQARDLVESGEALDWDELIKTALDSEQKIRKDFEQAPKIMDRLVALLRQVDPKFLKQLKPLIDRYKECMDWFIASICDVRWQLMALRAEARKGEVGPEFSDPRELRRYLASSRP